jgi:hypothetical protein
VKRRLLFVSALLVVPMLLPTPATARSSSDRYRLFFGDIHNHTRYSDGWEGTPRDAFVHARASGADYLATSDHNFMLTEEEWRRTKRQADQVTDDNFAALPASEYWIANGFGEVIVLNYEGIRTQANWRGPRKTLSRHEVIQDFYDWLAARSGALGHWPHPGLYGDLDKLDHYTPARDRAMASIEIHNYGSWLGDPAAWGLHDYENWYVLALDKGWHVMPAAVSDTHSPDWISGSPVRTVLLAKTLTPEALYGAMRASRGYATLDRNLKLRYTLNGAIMGRTLSGGSSFTARIRAQDPDAMARDAITRVELVSDHGRVVARRVTSGTDISVSFKVSSTTSRYYYVRVTTASDVTGGPGVTAWTAPVWTGR